VADAARAGAPALTALTGAPRETEAKLNASVAAFRRLEGLAAIGGWRVVERRTLRLRDAYWDTPDNRLGRAGCTVRVRAIDGAPEGELTFKGAPDDGAPAGSAGGSTVGQLQQTVRRAARRLAGQLRSGSRLELIARVPVGSGPADWLRLEAAQPVLDALRAAGALGELRPDIVLLNPRRELALRREDGAGEASLSLDEVRIEGQPYVRRYVEIELKAGGRADLDRLAGSIARRYGLRPSRRGKVQAARAWLKAKRRSQTAH
jgi:hypothetical protein